MGQNPERFPWWGLDWEEKAGEESSRLGRIN